jgi:hypothetical protein
MARPAAKHPAPCIRQAPPALVVRLKQLLLHGTYRPLPAAQPPGGCCGAPRAPPEERACGARVLLAAEAPLASLDGLATVITVPPLRLRPADAVALQRFYLRRAASRLGRGVKLELTPEAERHIQVGLLGALFEAPAVLTLRPPHHSLQRLGTPTLAPAAPQTPSPQAYSFPAGKEELQAAVLRAVNQARPRLAAAAAAAPPAAAAALPPLSPAASGASLDGGEECAVDLDACGGGGSSVSLCRDSFEAVGHSGDRLRFDLLTCAPWLRDFLRSEAWPEGLNHGFTKWAFGLVLAGLVLGPQVRGHPCLLGPPGGQRPACTPRQHLAWQWRVPTDLPRSSTIPIDAAPSLLHTTPHRAHPPGPRRQRLPQPVLVLVVARRLPGLPPGRPRLVQHLPLHGL